MRNNQTKVLHTQLITAKEIVGSCHGVLKHHGFESESDTEKVLKGLFSISRTLSGNVACLSDVKELVNGQASWSLDRCMVMVFVIAGSHEFLCKGRTYKLGNQGDVTHNVALFNVNQPTQIIRLLKKNRCVQKISLLIDHSWLDSAVSADPQIDSSLKDLLKKHLSFQTWRSSPGLQVVLNEMFECFRSGGISSRLKGEALVATTVMRVLEQLKPGDEKFQQYCRIKGHVDELISHCDANSQLSVEQVASHMGLSASTLQRAFKQGGKTTVTAYIRQRQLENAFRAIDQEGVSISEAAFKAGYRHCPNFVKAFKRCFGITPGQLNKQC